MSFDVDRVSLRRRWGGSYRPPAAGLRTGILQRNRALSDLGLDEDDKRDRVTEVDGLVLRWNSRRGVWLYSFNGESSSYGSLAAARRCGHTVIGVIRGPGYPEYCQEMAP